MRVAGRIVTETGIVTGVVGFGGRIERIEAADLRDEEAEQWVLPGFVDLHLHGGGGADTMRGEIDIRKLARFHATHGTTSLLATTVTAPPEDLELAAAGTGAVARRPAPGEARVLGLHLEGPFINPKRLGAQPRFTRKPDIDLFDRLRSFVAIRVLTMAPEMDEGLQFLKYATANGTRVQIGHSDADFVTACAALDAGASGFTHLFNAMRPFQHRDPGTAGAALARARHAEIIPDLQHVAPGAILAALRAVPQLYCITDAMEATGMPDGGYRLGTHAVTKHGAVATLADGTLAGSVLTMDAALRNLVVLGLEIGEAARRLSTIPADYLGLKERGRIAVGAMADLVVLGPDLAIRSVVLEGHTVHV
ncbi:MAG: N-acetylglucosamine-6-phosphate deacetylase [Geminicoccaceae bacterium]